MDYNKLHSDQLAARQSLDSRMTRARIAHGVIIAIAVVAWFPLGVLFLRLLKSKNSVRWHMALQTIGLVLLVVGFGLGGWVSERTDRSQEGHVMLGTVTAVLFLLMPVFGWLHHRHWKTTGGRNYKRHIHVWGGRAILFLGFINGGTGLNLSKARMSTKIAYGVIAGVFGVAYIGVAVWNIRQTKASVPDTERETEEVQLERVT